MALVSVICRVRLSGFGISEPFQSLEGFSCRKVLLACVFCEICCCKVSKMQTLEDENIFQVYRIQFVLFCLSTFLKLRTISDQCSQAGRI